jgi:hypothetical protein
MLEFREQPGGRLWKANQKSNGVLFEWSIEQSDSGFMFDTQLFINGDLFGNQASRSFKNALNAANGLKDDYFAYGGDNKDSNGEEE